MKSSLSAIQLLLQYLVAEGVEYIFGVPGGPLTPLYEALSENDRIRHILAKHEEGAVFMADGYARVKGGLGVSCTTSGPGATNAVTGVTCAYSDSIPILLLTAQVATAAFGKGAFQESGSYNGIDTVKLYQPITKFSAMLNHAQQMPNLIRQALRTALSGRTRPVHLSIPTDLARMPVDQGSLLPHQYRSSSFPTDIPALKSALEQLLSAKHPCILAGYGVRRAGACAELLELAEASGIPVATTPKAKSVFPENHPLSLGVFGFAGHVLADAYLLSEEVDCILVIGSSLGEFQTHTWDSRLGANRTFIQLDLDPLEIGRNYPVDLGIVGDAGASLRLMSDWIKILTPEHSPRKDALLEQLRQTVSDFRQGDMEDDGNLPMKPQAVLGLMNALLPEDTLLFVDTGNCMMWGTHYYQSRQADTFHIELGMASMGWAIGAAIGGKLAAPDRPVVALVGDGAFAMNGTEIHTAVEYNLPVIWIVLNNSGHGMVHNGEDLLFGKTFSDFQFQQPMNIGGLASSLGVRSFRVETPQDFHVALETALQAASPCLIEALVDMEACPPSLLSRSKTLKAFFGAVTAES